MIEEIYIHNFKSITNMTLKFGQFNCLIGMNGVGKSTILQALDFISKCMFGQVQEWLNGRGWLASDVVCKLHKIINIFFHVKYRTESGRLLDWEAKLHRSTFRCISEKIQLDDEILFKSTGLDFRIQEKSPHDITFIYYGSLLSQLKDSELPPAILEFREALGRIRSLELLSPQLMRKSSRTMDLDIGSGGEKLSAFLYRFKGEDRARLVELLKHFYPDLVDFKVTTQRAGWKKLSVIEQFVGKKLETEATHMNDGLLRILAILAQTASDRSMIMLDEIENGINQEIIAKLVETLVNAPRQILVTTHSPLILNYLDDDQARRSALFIYKTPQGATRMRHFFAIPGIGEKLSCMGPGDAFVDTDLYHLTQRCIEMDEANEPDVIEGVI
ncbi:MAG: AAA family ATPase [Magnetococcus sp. YQC-5]